MKSRLRKDGPQAQCGWELEPRTCRVALAFFAVLLLMLPAATAHGEGPLTDTPVYNPETKSYFELVAVKEVEAYLSLRNADEVDWEKAAALAHRRVFHGMRGRLAVIKSPQVHSFLQKTFRPNYGAWIGLRYLCKSRQLQWVTGEFQRADGFAPWHPVWEQSGVGGCTTQQYLSVMYTSVEEGFLWVTKGVIKEQHYYFVEYVTGSR